MADSKLARAAGFNGLGQGIYLKRPLSHDDTQTREEEKTHPTNTSTKLTIFIVGARLPHLLKYTQGYEKLYPSATVILVRCEPVSFWKPKWMLSAALHPVVEELEALGCITMIPGNDNTLTPAMNKTKHRILIQAFSNGGCLQLTAMRKALVQYQRTNVSASAVIFDSCPSIAFLPLTTRAFSSVVRFFPLRALVLLCMHPIYFFMNIRKRLFGVPMYWEAMRTPINQPQFLPWLQKSSPRLYIYSTTDDLVPWQDVESHAKDAERTYSNVSKERFEGSMHVSHLKHDPDRYWRIVQDAWNGAC
ncbi:Eukaryotic protein of unknown function (DUF829) domain containing protein [Amanita muscaria]